MASIQKHDTMVEEITEAGQAIQSLRKDELARTGLDPMAISLLPSYAMFEE